MCTDHYIANDMNAAIDTRGFLRTLEDKLATELFPDTREDFGSHMASNRLLVYDSIYNVALAKSASMPDEPSRDAIVCRFLTAEKFLWAVHQKSVFFSSPRYFDDESDSSLHEDFNDAILQNLPRIFQEVLAHLAVDAHQDMLTEEWASFERRKRDDWLISCWTELTSHKDDKLLSYKYASGRYGVGITATYGDLRDALENEASPYDRNGRLWSGSVNYDPRISKLPPFNKRNGFRGEHEVRFALHGDRNRRSESVFLDEMFFKIFNLRLSEDSPSWHKSALENLWTNAGGNRDGITEG